MVSFTVIINEAPYGMERAFSGLRFVRTCMFEGYKTNLFLIENGVYVAKRDQKPSAASGANVGDYLADLIKDGLEVKVCVVCIQSRGLTESDLISGVKIATMNELVEWTANSDKTIVF